MRVQEYEERTIKDAVSYLDKYAMVIQEPQDVVALFSNVEAGKRHVAMGLRYLFNFYQAYGFDKAYLDVLRNMLLKDQTGIDLKIPSEAKIVDSLRRLEKAPMKYQALYNVLLDSGLRLIEAVKLINGFEGAEKVNGFRRCEVGLFRGSKQAFYGHFSERTLQLIKQVDAELKPNSVTTYFRKHGCVAPKYLRKFAFDKMIELEIPESIADFIEGRVPKRIGAKHYMALARQGSKYYPRYAAYLETLRNPK